MNPYTYFGLQLDKKSCWIDSCIMALFFPNKMKNYFTDFIKSNNNQNISNIKNETLNVVSKIQKQNTIYNINNLRTLLNQYAQQQNNEELLQAFEKENEYGYVFYFLNEFLNLFEIPTIKINNKHTNTHIIELENCNGNTIQACLNHFQNKKSIGDTPYLIIEMTNSSLIPMENIILNENNYTLQSMIVYNCLHFITYVNKNNKWLLYDDFRTLNGNPMKLVEFGEHYTNTCKFAYGETNSFFFYIKN